MQPSWCFRSCVAYWGYLAVWLCLLIMGQRARLCSLQPCCRFPIFRLEPLWESILSSLYFHFAAALQPLAPDSAVRWIVDKKVVKPALMCGLPASYISIAQ